MLGIGILLAAFPVAHGVVLGALYLPVVAMLVGLMLRGVAFELRVKAQGWHRELWNWLFWAGSFIASFFQGVMLGRYITGFEPGFGYWAFAIVVGASLCGGYVLLGATWLDPQDRRRAAEKGARLGALGPAVGGARRGAGEPRHAARERDGAPQVVRLPAHALAHDPSGGHARAGFPRVPLDGRDRARRQGPRREALLRRGGDLRARVPRASPTASFPTS